MPAPAKQNLLLLQAVTREAQNQAAKEGALVMGLPRGPRSCLPLEATARERGGDRRLRFHAISVI